jgi:hypothetical protein
MNKSEIVEKARKRFAFEQYAKTVTWNTYEGDDDPFAFFPESGVYANGDIQLAWLGWQWRERAIAESQAWWISVEEKLPASNGEYLTHSKLFHAQGHYPLIRIYKYFRRKFHFCTEDMDWIPVRDVTHWMPLPNPPKGNENV